MSVIISGTGRAVPARRVTNDEIAARLETSDEWIRSHTGIAARHIAAEGETTSGLAAEASLKALEMAGVKPEELDMVIGATSSNDFIGFPTLACLVQGKIGAVNAGAVDMQAACTGFIYGLEAARCMIEAGTSSLKPKRRKKILVVGAEILSRITNWNDRHTCILFGDGAGACVIESDETLGRRGFLSAMLRADGADDESLIIRNGGTKHPFKAGAVVEQPPYVEMAGRSVYNFAVKAITDVINGLLDEAGLTEKDVDWFIPHQANARIVQAAAKRLGLGMERFFLNMDEYANTSAASVPIALDELNRTGRMKRGDLVLFTGFGGGLTYGGILMEW
jgi:3-oxoacyl-[acyl-carrier-protein] synthase-3